MGIVPKSIGYRILRRLSPHADGVRTDEPAYANGSKLADLLGESFLNDLKNKVVLDFGCGPGSQTIELARHGAKKVIGIDIQERWLELARQRAARAQVDHLCSFATQCNEPVDVIVAIDSFEHFADPAAVLRTMRDSIKPTGCVVASFGPTWYHPLGGHLFSVFPWAHLVFSETALIRWRADFKRDGATRFHEVDGGLNQMTIRRFERVVEKSPFRFENFETVAIRKLRAVHNRLTREFTTATVRCKLVPRS